MADIILLFERTDRQRVAPIVALLEERGWSVQWEPAADAGDATAREPAAANCIIAAWSIDSVDSAAVLAVASHGLARGILVSVSIDFSRPPRELDQAPAFALAGWTGDATSPRAQELVVAVGELLARAPAQPAAQSATQPAANPDGHAPAAVVPTAALAARLAPDVDFESEKQPALEVGPEPEYQPAHEAEPEPATQHEPEADVWSAERAPHRAFEQRAAQPAWTFPEEPEEDRSRLPPVLLRERVEHPTPADAPPASLARRLAAVALVAGLVAAAAAGSFWVLGLPGDGQAPGSDVAAVEVAPETTPKSAVTPPFQAPLQETKSRETKLQDAKPRDAKPRDAAPPEAKPQEIPPMPAALPQDKGLDIEDLLGQVTPRVEELLADARQLIRSGDIPGARKVLAAAETADSGSLTFLLAETYDPNVLPAGLKATMADSQRAKALYRRARDLGDGRAQGRLDALKTSGWVPAASRRVAYLACPAGTMAG
jgi:hypothetical protein